MALLQVFTALLRRLALAAALPPASWDSQIARKYIEESIGRYDWSRAGFGGGERPIPTVLPGKVFSVKQYGAKGDGKADDSTAVKAALKATLAGGGVLRFPKGTYRLHSPLYIARSGVVVAGEGSGMTTLIFDRSLSQVYGGTYTVDPCGSGKIKSSWAFGGGFITISGKEQRPKRPLELASPIGDYSPGATRLRVNSTSNLREGMWVTMLINDKSTTLPPGLNESEYVNCTLAGRRRLQGFPRVFPLPQNKDPILQLALEAAATETDEFISPQQAAAADAMHAVSGGGAVASMAPSGSVAAWIYGNNRVESGGPGAIDFDTVRYSFRIKAVGKGYIEMDRPTIHPIRQKWRVGLHQHSPGIEEVGVQGLTIRFRNSGKYGEHLTDRGYNGVAINAVRNAWVNDVRVIDADNGVFLSNAEFSTLAGITITTTRNRAGGPIPEKKLQGHHAISASTGQSILITKFNVAKKYWHDVTVATDAVLCVVRNGTGLDINVDYHRAGPFANLITNSGFGLGNRPFASGGRGDRGVNTGRGSVAWNLHAKDRSKALDLPDDCEFGPLLSFYGNFQGNKCSKSGWIVKALPAGAPPDLYVAQVQERQRLLASLTG